MGLPFRDWTNFPLTLHLSLLNLPDWSKNYNLGINLHKHRGYLSLVQWLRNVWRWSIGTLHKLFQLSTTQFYRFSAWCCEAPLLSVKSIPKSTLKKVVTSGELESYLKNPKFKWRSLRFFSLLKEVKCHWLEDVLKESYMATLELERNYSWSCVFGEKE